MCWRCSLNPRRRPRSRSVNILIYWRRNHLGEEMCSYLMIFLGYVKTCHLWVEAHPELAYEADQRARENLGPLLAEEPRLAEFFRNYNELIAREPRGREERLRAEQKRTEAALLEVRAFVRAVGPGKPRDDHCPGFNFRNGESTNACGESRRAHSFGFSRLESRRGGRSRFTVGIADRKGR